MSNTIWKEITESIDEETGVCFDYSTPYRNGWFFISLEYENDGWAILYTVCGESGFYTLKEGLKTLTSAKRYFTQHERQFKGKIDCLYYEEEEG